jgi:hypothetical protein
MLKKLEIDALMADLESVKALLAERTEYSRKPHQSLTNVSSVN